MLYVFSEIREYVNNPNVLIGIQVLGKVNFDYDAQTQAYRQIQYEVAAENPHVFILSEAYDGKLVDDAHMTDDSDGKIKIAERNAASIISVVEDGKTIASPALVAAYKNTLNTIHLEFTESVKADALIPSRQVLFRDGMGVEIEPESVSISDPVVEFVFSSDISGLEIEVMLGYGNVQMMNHEGILLGIDSNLPPHSAVLKVPNSVLGN